MRKSFFILFAFAFSIVCGNNARAQGYDIKERFYDGIVSSRVVKKQSDFNLKGKVKSCTEDSPQLNQRLSLSFDPAGLLLKKQVETLEQNGKIKQVTAYTFTGNKLKSVKFEDAAASYTSQKIFDLSGYLEKEIMQVNDPGKKYYREADYTYNSTFDDLKIAYTYNLNLDNRDVVLSDAYTFTFNDKHQLIKERNESKHKETTYGSTANIIYDLAGNITAVTFMDDCALSGGNSCANLALTVKYDNRNNIIFKSMSDQTVRNAGWSDSYTYSATYNEHNDVISTSGSSGNPSFRTAIKPEASVVKYEYEYDSEGNWIKKYELAGDKRTFSCSRNIEYYD